MKKVLICCSFLISFLPAFSQDVSKKLMEAFIRFESDSQLKHAISSLYVIDAKTGAVVFDKNSQVGLAGASTQKVITAVTAYELLGKEYHYITRLSYTGELEKGILKGNLVINPSGDPAFGSWRYSGSQEKEVITAIVKSISDAGIEKIEGSVVIDTKNFSGSEIPERWIMQDVGNYYGAGAFALNWRENQFDMYLKSGLRIGDSVSIVRTVPVLFDPIPYHSELSSAKAGSGDNAYIYLYPKTVRGTIPVNENNFKISGAMEDPGHQFVQTLIEALQKKGVRIHNKEFSFNRLMPPVLIYEHGSPAFDSLVYWFLKKSINLYGEAFIKIIGLKTSGIASPDSGLANLRRFWNDKGLDEASLNMYDGSGLSPMNRITTAAQVSVLRYALDRNWFASFYDALPEYNAMKMKSGTIGDVKGFCGYHTSKNGKQYIFSFLVNNYQGKSSSLVNKMYTVLNELK